MEGWQGRRRAGGGTFPGAPCGGGQPGGALAALYLGRVGGRPLGVTSQARRGPFKPKYLLHLLQAGRGTLGPIQEGSVFRGTAWS